MKLIRMATAVAALASLSGFSALTTWLSGTARAPSLADTDDPMAPLVCSPRCQVICGGDINCCLHCHL